jgi:hypothetical protein
MQNQQPLDYLGNAIQSHHKARPALSLLKTNSTN